MARWYPGCITCFICFRLHTAANTDDGVCVDCAALLAAAEVEGLASAFQRIETHVSPHIRPRWGRKPGAVMESTSSPPAIVVAANPGQLSTVGEYPRWVAAVDLTKRLACAPTALYTFARKEDVLQSFVSLPSLKRWYRVRDWETLRAWDAERRMRKARGE